jgi:HSP20 family protein
MSLMRQHFPNFENFTPALKVFDEAFDRFLSEPAALRPWSPAVDVAESDNEVTLTADLPGLTKEQIQVRIEDGALLITGERKFANEDKKTGYHRIERSYGNFKRYFSLPDTVQADKVEAKYENGVLQVTLPKKELAKPRTIEVALKS